MCKTNLLFTSLANEKRNFVQLLADCSRYFQIMSDWESDGDTPAPIQPRYDQNRGYGTDRRDYQQKGNRHDHQGRDNRQHFGSGRRDNQQNFGRRDDNYCNGGSDGGYNRGGGNASKMEVDSTKVGMIIGKGGSKIREIQDNHNVNVKIGERTVNEMPFFSICISIWSTLQSLLSILISFLIISYRSRFE